VRRDVPAGGSAEGLAQRAGEDVDAVLDAEELRRSATAGTDETDRVRVVDEDHGSVRIRELADPV